MPNPGDDSPADRLAACLAAVDRLADRLVELDSRPAIALADPAARRGRSAAVASTVRADLGAVWAAFPSLSAWRSGAEAVVAGGIPSPNGARRLLDRPVALGGATLRAEDAVTAAATLLDGVEVAAEQLRAAWTAAVARGRELGDRLDAVVVAAPGTGTGTDGARSAREAVAAWVGAATADPLDPPDDTMVVAAVTDLEQEQATARGLGARRADAGRRLPAQADALDAVAGRLGAASPAPELVALAGRLRRLAAAPGGLDTTAALDRADGLLAEAGRLAARGTAVLDERAAPARRRADLAGLLAACRAKAAALGVDDDAGVRRAGDEAAAAVAARPFAPAEAERRVERLRALVAAADSTGGGAAAAGRAASGPAADRWCLEVFTAPPSPVDPAARPSAPPGALEVHAIATLTPPPPHPPVPMVEVLVVDCSGSVDDRHPRLPAVLEAVAAAVDRLDDGTWFAVVAGRSDASVVYPSGDEPALARADDDTRAAARHALAGLQAGGGTEMSRWVRLLRRLLAAAPAGHHHAVVVADGRNAGGDAGVLDRELQRSRGLFRVDGLAVGSLAEAADLRHIADALDGTFALVAPAELAPALAGLVDRAEAGAATAGLVVRHPDGVTARLLPAPGGGPGAGAGPGDVHVCLVVPAEILAAGGGEVARLQLVVGGETGPTVAVPVAATTGPAAAPGAGAAS